MNTRNSWSWGMDDSMLKLLSGAERPFVDACDGGQKSSVDPELDFVLAASLSRPGSPFGRDQHGSPLSATSHKDQLEIDHERAQRCTAEGLINFCDFTTQLSPVKMPTKSKTLLHAVCTSLCGRIDFQVVRVMEDVLRTTMQGPMCDTFASRWQGEMKLNPSQVETQREWDRLSNLVCPHGQTLEGIHVHVLSWILKRPILVLSLDCSQKNPRIGERNRVEGLHLPLGQVPHECDRHALVLGYTGKSFAPFLFGTKNSLVPLCDSNRSSVRVSFMCGERDDPVTVLQRYVDVVGQGPAPATPCTRGSSAIVVPEQSESGPAGATGGQVDSDLSYLSPQSPGLRYLKNQGRRPSPLRSPLNRADGTAALGSPIPPLAEQDSFRSEAGREEEAGRRGGQRRPQSSMTAGGAPVAEEDWLSARGRPRCPARATTFQRRTSSEGRAERAPSDSKVWYQLSGSGERRPRNSSPVMVHGRALSRTSSEGSSELLARHAARDLSLSGRRRPALEVRWGIVQTLVVERYMAEMLEAYAEELAASLSEDDSEYDSEDEEEERGQEAEERGGQRGRAAESRELGGISKSKQALKGRGRDLGEYLKRVITTSSDPNRCHGGLWAV